MPLLGNLDQDLETLRRGTRRFILAGFALLVVLIALILVRQGLFRPTVSLGFVADSALDIAKGTPVRIAGLRVGSVTDISLRSDGQVDVELELDARHMRFVTKDALAELRKDGLVGSAAIDILPGPDRNVLASADARLRFSRAEGLTAIANQLRADVQPILRDIKTITGTLSDSDKGLPAILARVHGTTDKLDALLAVGKTQATAVGNSTTHVLGKAEQDLTQLARTLESVNARLPGVLDTTQTVLKNVEAVSAAAKTEVPGALRDGRSVTADVHKIVDGAKQAWPIRNWVGERSPASIREDSDPRAEGGIGARH